MGDQPLLESVSACTASIGRDAATHFELYWRDLVNSAGCFQNDQYYRVITGEHHPLGNFAIVSSPGDAALACAAAEPLLALDAPTAVLFPAGLNEAASQQLVEMGFTKLDPMPAMAVDIVALAATALPEGYTFTRVCSGDQASNWTEVVSAGYPIPQGLARMLSPEVQEANPDPDAKTQFYAVRHGERLVAASMLYLARGLAGIYCVATLPEERGKGLGAHVTAEALRAASHAGYNVGVLQSSEAGHSIYLDLGFQDVGEVHMFVRMPAGS